MTIVYCDWLNGNDTTGDGSAALPYKTIQKASTGLTGGDEVRVAKSTDPASLTGTISFTDGSTTVTGSGTAFSTELASGDFIELTAGSWWEVLSIASDTSLTLYQMFSGTTTSGYTSRRMTASAGITDTGAAPTSTTLVQYVQSSGSSASNRLTISGGWDLSTQTQTGTTTFRQTHSTLTNRWGYGLYVSGKSFLAISNLSFLRYNRGVYFTNSSNTNVASFPNLISNANHGVMLNIANDTQLSVGNALANERNDGVQVAGGTRNTVRVDVADCNGIGLDAISGAHGCIFTVGRANRNGSYGVMLSSCGVNTVSTGPLYLNQNYGLYINSSPGTRASAGDITMNGASYAVLVAASNLAEVTLGAVSGATYSLGVSGCVVTVNNMSTSGGSYGVRCDSGGAVRLYNCSIGQSSEVFFDRPETRQTIHSTKHDGVLNNDWVFFPAGYANKQSAVTQSGSGYAWRLNPTTSYAGPLNPVSISVAKVAVAANRQVTVTAYVKKDHATNIGALIRLRGKQIAGVAADVVATAADNTNWQQLTLQFTPTEAGVVNIDFEAYYVADASYAYIDSLEVSQA